MKSFHFFSTCFVLMSLVLSGCAGLAQTPTPTPLAPPDYLENTLQWLQTNAVFGKNLDWTAVRAQIKALNLDLQTTASTYPALCLALGSLKDSNAWLQVSQPPAGFSGYGTLYPENRVIVVVDSGSPAEQAGLQVGDVIESVNGLPPKPYDNLQGTVCDPQSETVSPQDQLSLRRAGQDGLIQVTVKKIPAPLGMDPTTPLAGRRIDAGSNGMGYLELPSETGDLASYAGAVQQLIKKLDSAPTCGWIIDLRRISGGDIWSYLAAIGPILGEGDLGGFIYPDSRKEAWSYRQGSVYWAGNRRDESNIDGPVYHLKQGMPPVALLTSPVTTAAGELAVVAFQGRPGVRTFGEATFGLPTLIAHTPLSDGAHIFVSGAFSYDRTGKTFQGPLAPDVTVVTNWSQFGAAQDPVILAAQSWLQAQPACKP